MIEKYEEVLKSFLNFYGVDNQYREFNSEFGELAIELANFLTPDFMKEKNKILAKSELHENLKTEFADAIIMLWQMVFATGITVEELEREICWKIKRQEFRIEKKRKELEAK